MEEALEALQSEREQKYAVKKELDKRINSESLVSLTSFAGFAGLKFGPEEPLDEAVESNLQKLSADLLAASAAGDRSPPTGPSSLEGSLFGEVHLNEIKKLERLLEEADAQKLQTGQRLQESQLLLERAQTEAREQSGKLLRLLDQLNGLLAAHATAQSEPETSVEFPELARLKAALEARAADSDASHVAKLRSQLQAHEAKALYLEDDLRTTTAIAEDLFASLSLTQDELVAVSEDLAALYHHLCLGKRSALGPG